jgi:hypothetical protein
MKIKSTFKRLMPALLIIPLVMCLVSCEDEDSSSNITPERFYLERDLLSYSGTDVYDWDTTLSQAIVHFRVDDFRNGDASVGVFDADGIRIFFRVLNTADSVFLVGDNDFEFVGSTAVGTPGRWRIELRYDDVTGETKLTME